jgi:alkylation response protein AidB-like acyl-CoA dehydrogenase
LRQPVSEKISHDLDEFAVDVREFLSGNATPRPTLAAAAQWGQGEDRISYFGEDPADVADARVADARDWQRRRYQAGFGWITGPPEYGGRGLPALADLLYDTIEAEYDVPDTAVLSLIGLGMVGPTILAHGQQGARERYLPAMYRGELIACQLFSEPGAGSDLASLSTKAVRDGDHWVVTGQKVWTSGAQYSEIGMVLCRTSPDKPKHKGITAFVVDMSAPGVEIRPLRQMSGGAEFNEVFLDGVRVPDADRLGEVDDGWRVAMTTLMHERASVGGEGAGPSAARAVTPQFLAAMLKACRSDDGGARRKLGELSADLLATEYLTRQTIHRMLEGAQPGPEASVLKLMFGQNLTRGAHFAAELAGPLLTVDTGTWGTFSWNELLLSTPALRILGGTEEIMKNILAERVLGLPKEPNTDSRVPFRELRSSGTGGGA